MQKPTFAAITAKAKAIYSAMKQTSNFTPFKLWNHCLQKASYLLRQAYRRFKASLEASKLQATFDKYFLNSRNGETKNGIFDYVSTQDIKQVFTWAKFEYRKPKRKISRSGMVDVAFKNSFRLVRV